MKRLIGYTCFCIAVGMLLSMLFQVKFLMILVIAGLLILGYCLFCSDCKCK